jgi:hypothetical protein
MSGACAVEDCTRMRDTENSPILLQIHSMERVAQCYVVLTL